MPPLLSSGGIFFLARYETESCQLPSVPAGISFPGAFASFMAAGKSSLPCVVPGSAGAAPSVVAEPSTGVT